MIDNAVCVANPDQRDTDNDGIGDVIDADLDNDGIGAVGDVNIFRAAFGSQAGNPNYNQAADFDGDGTVSISDFSNVMRALFMFAPTRFSMCP